MLEALDAIHNKHPHIKFNTFDVVRDTKPTDETLEGNNFTFRLISLLFYTPYDLDVLNSELETRIKQPDMNQYYWSMQVLLKDL